MKIQSLFSGSEARLAFYLLLLGSVFFICHECIGMFLDWMSDSYQQASAQSASFK